MRHWFLFYLTFSIKTNTENPQNHRLFLWPHSNYPTYFLWSWLWIIGTVQSLTWSREERRRTVITHYLLSTCKDKHHQIISLCQGPKPAVSAGQKKQFRCFVVGSINCHSESENFLKFLLTCANFSKFNPGDNSWRFWHSNILKAARDYGSLSWVCRGT
jgi:hypothetical protein